MDMKKRRTVFAAGLVFSVMALPMAGAQDQSAKLKNAMEKQVALGIQAVPKAFTDQVIRAASSKAFTDQAIQTASLRTLPGPNPFLSKVVDLTKVDFYSWRMAVASQAVAAQKTRDAAQDNFQVSDLQPLVIDELEPDSLSGLNDTLATKELVKGFGTDTNPKARILGVLAPLRDVYTDFPGFAEFNGVDGADDGAIPFANETGVATSFGAIQTSGIIGDGAHGSAASGTGDFDFYRVELLSGQSIIADTDITGDLDSVLVIYNAAGEVVAVNDDDGVTLASKLTYTPAEAGTFFIMVSGFGEGIIFPEDPFDPASGLGVGSEGAYELLITTAKPDIDVYAVDLRAGDVLGATLQGAGSQLQIFEPNGTEAIGSSQDLSALYPVASPLPGGGNAVVAYTASVDAQHFIIISGNTEGSYEAIFEVYRAGLEDEPRGSVQTIFLDFDGARVQTSVFDGPGQRDFTGLAAFLGGWGLRSDDEDSLIDAIVKVVKENLHDDLKRRGLNEKFGVKVFDSRNPYIEFGSDQVSRVVIGGTIQESGIETFAAASSIDPGNFGYEDDAFVLLDLLSAPVPSPFSINTYFAENADTEDRINFVAIGVGNLVAHEIGHYLGSYHTDESNNTLDLMDEGGNLANILGVGDDLVFGTDDDIDIDFGQDSFSSSEGLFTGIEDTLNNSAFGLTVNHCRSGRWPILC
ncbi:MAG: hypothetical protein GXP14_15900 [Gammaproteobacteria bacterium]|nr:hypothetical protein [Gammaproteobacteria bacterium]